MSKVFCSQCKHLTNGFRSNAECRAPNNVGDTWYAPNHLPKLRPQDKNIRNTCKDFEQGEI